MTGIPIFTEQAIAKHLDGIAGLFKPGAKITLLVRNDVGADKDADFVMTSDTLDAAIAALEIRKARAS
ncbi:MAG: hypothetical protein ACTHM0_13570 [Sphingomonas sp.]